MGKKYTIYKPNQRGFTLVELMITLVIAAILVSVAVPNFTNIIQNNRATAQANEFLTALSIARSEALKRGEAITMTTAGTADDANDWAGGWTITDTANTTLYVNSGFGGGGSLTNVNDVTSVAFNSRGFLVGTQAITFNARIPDCSGNEARNITITPTGRAAITKVAC